MAIVFYYWIVNFFAITIVFKKVDIHKRYQDKQQIPEITVVVRIHLNLMVRCERGQKKRSHYHFSNEL